MKSTTTTTTTTKTRTTTLATGNWQRRTVADTLPLFAANQSCIHVSQYGRKEGL
jgi:hypothetical protein